ncbi:unnamed protein product [Ambrosiozyma monospora]|uniref:Unnamed protein product n=1 Tax=Ambrosiozyma monospora TaxID=43982 RepID=A0ACB5TDF8_AMBMO|nr:unnamed protein product [Ambrosiozyma monospora]
MEQNAFPNGFGHRQNRGVGNHSSRIREHKFIFDKLFDQEATQEAVYNATSKPMIDSVMEGFNSTVFAYGATGCGKTHTITGTQDSPGVIFLTMKDLFDRMEEMKNDFMFELTLSYLEIYNEKIKDLLNPSTDPRSLCIREDTKKTVVVTNLSRHMPQSVEDVMELIMIGNGNRTVCGTAANATSSRSHAVLQITVVKKAKVMELNDQQTIATLSIIDLAGSERASATKNKGARLFEGANINKSLLALGNCINALCDPNRRHHVPYRDSKLTRLLKFSLGGNCKTVMIVCVSPSSKHYDETLNTLKYANRAKEIKTKLVRNQQNLSRHVGSYLKMITEQKAEIEELKKNQTELVQRGIDLRMEKIDRCDLELTRSIDELKRSLDKNRNVMMTKAYYLARLKMFMLHKFL